MQSLIRSSRLMQPIRQFSSQASQVKLLLLLILNLKELKEVCEELGIKEEELQPKDPETFQEPRLPRDIAKLRYNRYEAKRKGIPY